MACENKKTRRLSIIILCLMFCGLPLVAPRNIDCKGKPFHCVNSTHFIICVDLGGGISSTVDDVIIPCPESTICDINNHFECEFPPPTTLTLPIQPSDVSNDSGLGKNKVITKVSWENIDITTTSSVQKTSERSEKYLNNVSIITIQEEFTTTKAKLEAFTDGQSTTIHQDNINRQSNNNEKQSQQFLGNSIIDESNNLDVVQSDINKNENTKGTKSNSYTIDIRPTQTNEEFRDRKLSSMGSGTEITPLQNSISSPDITELYSYTPGNRDVITLDASFTTDSEILTSDVMSVNTPMLSNSTPKSSKILESDKKTNPHAVTTESKKTSTVEPKFITLSYNSSNSSSQIDNDNSTAEATLNESNPINFLNESINSTIEAKTSRKINEYQSSNSSNEMDKISYFNEVSATESFTNITPRVSEKYLQSNSTQDHLLSIASENKYLESEQFNNTTDKYEQKNTKNIISDVTTRPNITDVQKGSANQENSDMSVSNPIEILPATDSSIFTTHKQDKVRNQIKNNITKLNIHEETTMNDLNTNYYVTDSYGVSYDQSTKTFDVRNFHKNGYTTNTFGTEEVTATNIEKNTDIITIALHNNTETTRANKSETKFLDNASAVISSHDKPEENIVWHRSQTKITVPYNHKDNVSSKNQHQSTQTTNSGYEKVIVTTADSNVDMITTTVPNYNFEQNKEETTKNVSKTLEDGVKHETQKNITTLFIHGGKAISDLNNKSYAKDDSSSKNQHQSTQTTNSGNDQFKVTDTDSNLDMITTTVPNYNFQQNKEETTKNVSKKHEDGVVKHETQKNITTLFINGGEAMSDLNNGSYVKEDSSSKNHQSTQTTNSGNEKVIVTTAGPNIDIITTTVPNYNFEQNKEETTKNVSKTLEDGVKHETQKNITTLFIDGGKVMSDLSNKSYAKDDGSSKNEFQFIQTTNSGNDQVKVTITDSNLDMITITVPNYNSQKNKEEPTKNVSKTHEDGVVKHETQKNITTLFFHGGKVMSDLNNKSYAKDDSSSKTQHQSTQTTSSGDEKVIVTTADSNIDIITTTVPNYNFEQNNEETTKNMSKTLDGVKNETQKNIPTLFIHGGKAMSDLNNKSNAKDDSSSKNQHQSTQTTNSGDEKVIVTTADSNIDIITTTVPNYNFEQNKEETRKNVSKTLEDGVKHEIQKNIPTSFIDGGKDMSDSSNTSYAKDDGSSKNEFQSTQTTNSGYDQVKVTITDSNLDMTTITVPNYNSQKNKEETTKNVSKTHEDGVVKHETLKNITTLFIQGGEAMSDLNNKSYAKDDSSSKNQHQSTKTTNSGDEKVIVTTADSNIDIITATVPNYNFEQSKEETTKSMSKTLEDGVKNETQKNITTLFIHGGKAMSNLNNKSYAKDDSSSKNQHQSTQTTNSGDEKVIVTTADSNIDIITTTVPNYNFEHNKEETTKHMSKTLEDGVKHETQKNIPTSFIDGGKDMSDSSNTSYAKDDGSSKNEFQSTQTTNSGYDQVKVTIADPNLDMTTITVPNYNSQKNKEETTKNVSKTHEDGVVKHETLKNITTLFIQGGEAMSDLNNKSYAKDESSSKNQHQSTQTTNSGYEKVIVTTADSNNTTSSFDGEKATSDSSNKSYAKENDSQILYQSTQTSNQYNFIKNSVLKKELPFNYSKNSFEADKIIAMEHNTTITTDVADFMFTKVDDSGLKTNLNNYTDTFVSTYNSNIHFTKSNIDTDRHISDRFTTITERNINGNEMTPTQVTNDMAFKPKSAPINESKISSETKSSTPISTVKGTNSAHRYFAKNFGDGKVEKNDKPLSNVGQEISSRANRQAGNQMDNYNIKTTTIIVSEIRPNSSQKYGEDLTAKRIPNYPDVKVSTTISQNFNSYTLKQIGTTEKYTMLTVIDAKNFTAVAEDFLTAVSTASYNLPKKISTTSISEESMSGITFVNNGSETTLSSSGIINTNIPQYDETKVGESKSLQTSLRHSLNIEADTTTPLSESDKVTSVLNRAVNTRDVTLLKKKSHTENYQVTENPALSLINLTSLAVSPSNNKILHTSLTNTLVDIESATNTSTNQPQQLKKTKKLFNFYTTDAEVNENIPNKGIIKSIQSRDIPESKASTTSEALRLKEKFRNESILNNNQQSDIIPSEFSIKVGSNTGLHASTIEKNVAQKISKHFKDNTLKQNSSRFLSQTIHTHYASSTTSSLEKSDRSITTAKMKINTASTIRNTNDMTGAPLVTETTINKRKKKSKTNDIAKDTLLENLHESDGNISSMTSNKYKDLSNNSNSNITIDADKQADSKSKELNKNLEITSERTNFFLINGQKPYKDMSVNSNYRNVSNDTQRVFNYYTNSTTRGFIKTTTKNTTTMAKRIRDVNSKTTNTDPTSVVVILFDYGRQTQKKEGKSVTNDTNFEENPDDNIHVDSSSHNRYENSDPNDIKVESMTKANNADNDNGPQNSSTPKVDGRIKDTDMVLCGRYTRGRYPDKTDCRKFYICVGRNPPIRGTCPNNTVYSESRKQCTKNLSHCVRNNNFKCLTEGRFSDFLKDDIYNICIKNKLGDFVLYKFQCQNGFRLDKKTVKCIKETENSSSSVSSASENSKRNNKSTTEKTSKVTDKFECQEEGKFAGTRDCRTYYVCSKKRNVYRRKKKKCESDERFDRDKKKCVDAESYECDI